MEDKAETIGEVTTVVEVGTYNKAKVLLPPVEVAPASLFLPARRRF